MTILCYQTIIQLPTRYSHHNVQHISQFQFGNLKVSNGKHMISLPLKPAPSSSFYSTICWDSHARNLGVILGLSFILLSYSYWLMMPYEYYLLNISENISFLLPLPQLMALTIWQAPGSHTISSFSHSNPLLLHLYPISTCHQSPLSIKVAEGGRRSVIRWPHLDLGLWS